MYYVDLACILIINLRYSSLPDNVADDHQLNQAIHYANFLVVDVHYFCRLVF